MTDVIDPVEALLKLTNEVGATLGADYALRSAIGNTNYNVLKLRYEEARAALTASEAAGLVLVKREVLEPSVLLLDRGKLFVSAHDEGKFPTLWAINGAYIAQFMYRGDAEAVCAVFNSLQAAAQAKDSEE